MTTAADVDTAVRLAITTFERVGDADWDDRADGLDWTCWETVEHMANDLFSYAARFAVSVPRTDRKVAFDYSARRPGGPGNVVYADRDLGVEGLLQVLDACGGFLSAILRSAPPDAVAAHVFGASNPEGFAAMAVVEILVHTHDVVPGFTPPADLCDRALRRLFPDAPLDTERWPTLLWATGRGELPGRARLVDWRWRG